MMRRLQLLCLDVEHFLYNNHVTMLQGAITTIQDAFFDLQKSDLMDRLTAAGEQSRLAYFISDEDALFSIEKDLSNFRKALKQQQEQSVAGRGRDETDEELGGGSSVKPLLPLKSAIEKLHLALKKEVNVPDSISQAMMEETIMDLAAAVEQGHFDEDDEEEVDTFAPHSSVIASVLKSNIAVLYEELLQGYEDDMMLLDFTTIPLLLVTNPTEMMITPGTAASTNKEYYHIMGDCPISNAAEAVGGGCTRTLNPRW
jgi:hypothetical protein